MSTIKWPYELTDFIESETHDAKRTYRHYFVLMPEYRTEKQIIERYTMIPDMYLGGIGLGAWYPHKANLDYILNPEITMRTAAARWLYVITGDILMDKTRYARTDRIAMIIPNKVIHRYNLETVRKRYTNVIEPNPKYLTWEIGIWGKNQEEWYQKRVMELNKNAS